MLHRINIRSSSKGASEAVVPAPFDKLRTNGL
jgi:hypothetical protein